MPIDFDFNFVTLWLKSCIQVDGLEGGTITDGLEGGITADNPKEAITTDNPEEAITVDNPEGITANSPEEGITADSSNMTSDRITVDSPEGHTKYTGIAILDGENAIMHKSKNIKFLQNFFIDCKEMNLLPVIVAKVSNLNRLKKRIPEVEIPDDIHYFFLHGNNQNCPDDAFIIELYARLKNLGINTKIFTIDKFSNRKGWNDKLYKTMISYNLAPARPRICTEPNVLIYQPNLDFIINTEINDKINLRID